MRSKDIKQGETYIFLSTDSPARKHLEGEEFTVREIKRVWRRFTGKGKKNVQRFFNEAGDGARAEELEPLPEKKCHICQVETDFTCNRCDRYVCEACTVAANGQNNLTETICRTCQDMLNDYREF